MINSINVVGNLTGEPELRYTQSGTAMVSGSIASNRRYQVNGEWQEQTSYFNFTAWRELAENIASTMSKGMRVVATGRMEQKDWVDKDGNKRTSYDLVLDEIGPSLRWATAVVTKTDKNGSGSSSPSIVAASAAFNATVTEEDPF
jgi:single-strand DNA-binding protein